MKKPIYLRLILLIAFILLIDYTYAKEDVDTNEYIVVPYNELDTTPRRFVEVMPEFPGGNKEYYRYLKKELKYPENCRIKGIQGIVVIEFVVEENGKITNVKVTKSVDPDLDKEALRVVEHFPDWIPGEHQSKRVRVSYTIPISFSLK